MTVKFELISPVWQNAEERLAAGTVVTFEDDEPTGIFIGRVRELQDTDNVIEVATPKKAKNPPAPPQK